LNDSSVDEETFMLTRDKILELLQAKYTFLATEFGVSKIGLFGSFAKSVGGDVREIWNYYLLFVKRNTCHDKLV